MTQYPLMITPDHAAPKAEPRKGGKHLGDQYPLLENWLARYVAGGRKVLSHKKMADMINQSGDLLFRVSQKQVYSALIRLNVHRPKRRTRAAPTPAAPRTAFALTPHALIDAGRALTDQCHGAAFAAGWWHDIETGEAKPYNVMEKLMLVVTEVAEAAEGYRKGLMDDHLPHLTMLEVELADAVIRIGDLAGALKLDLGRAMAEKMAYNANRADHKLENRRAAGGKKC